MKLNKLLTIQDLSCMGQCSLGVALPIISCLGVEVCAIPSAVLSTHTSGFENYTFRDLTDDLPDIIEHWQTMQTKFDAIYTGYIANAKQLAIIKNIFEMHKKNASLTIVDPVMGDHGKAYKGFDKNFIMAMTTLCTKADIIIPNLTEACFLIGEDYIDSNLNRSQTELIFGKLAKLGTKNVVMSGVSFEPNRIGAGILNVQDNTIEYCFADKVEGTFHGTGDMFASVIAGALVKGESLKSAVQLAVNFVSMCLKKSINDPNKHDYGVNFEGSLGMLTNF